MLANVKNNAYICKTNQSKFHNSLIAELCLLDLLRTHVETISLT